MLYYLFQYLENQYHLPGASLFQFTSFRAALAGVSSLLIATIYGKKIIKLIKKLQIRETVRDLELKGQKEKEGTPTMGGIIIIMATLIPAFLVCQLGNIYIILLIITVLWMGVIGFLDDYIKIFRKNKKGLKGKFKVVGQIGLGLIVGVILFFHPDVVIKEKAHIATKHINGNDFSEAKRSLKTTIPFFKNNELNYSEALSFLGKGYQKYGFILFIPLVIFLISAVSNGTNLTDGLDGLAASTSAVSVATLGLFVWVSGNIVFSNYLNIMYIPNIGEVSVFAAAFAGGLIGFLWYNTYPAQIFMGDTGSLTIGAVIAVMAIAVRKELLLPLFGGVFLLETLSVMIQVAYFKYTKIQSGQGKRIFLMSPLHHHFQKKGYHESKIVARFLIFGLLLAMLAVLTLKVR